MNGKPGDHELTDILIHGLKVYGEETDDLIRKIAKLCSRRELDEWWSREIGSNVNKEEAHAKSRARYEELLKRAKRSGWELAE